MKQQISRAHVFVDRYSKDDFRGSDDLDKYVRKCEDRLRPSVAGAICSRIVDKINFKNHQRLLRGLRSLKEHVDGDIVREMQERITDVCQEYECKKEESYRRLKPELESLLKHGLKEYGISGSAIAVNVKASSQWDAVLAHLDPTYNKLLGRVKKDLGSRMTCLPSRRR